MRFFEIVRGTVLCVRAGWRPVDARIFAGPSEVGDLPKADRSRLWECVR